MFGADDTSVPPELTVEPMIVSMLFAAVLSATPPAAAPPPCADAMHRASHHPGLVRFV